MKGGGGSRPAFLEDAALRAVLEALPGARVVGGAVRDWLAGHPVADIDLATPEPPEAVMRALDAAGLKHAPTGLSHGTVTAISGGRGFEVTTLRRDERTDGRHAEVAWTDDWREDAARRDFTINAMSMDRDGVVSDYFGGAADLRAGRVRFVGDAAGRIGEDYLRVLRYFRFHARYAAGAPDEATGAALRAGAPWLRQLSVERVWSELKRILAVAEPPGLLVATMALMGELGVLSALALGDAAPERLAALVRAGAPADPLLRLAALLPGAAGLADRLKLSKAEAARLAGFEGAVPAPDSDDASLRRALVAAPEEALTGRAWLAGGDGPGWAGLRARLAGMKRPCFPLAGRDAVALGLEPGPAIGRLLEEVWLWWMAGGCTATAAECRARLASLAGH